jgi:hypothetical protein
MQLSRRPERQADRKKGSRKLKWYKRKVQGGTVKKKGESRKT